MPKDKKTVISKGYLYIYLACNLRIYKFMRLFHILLFFLLGLLSFSSLALARPITKEDIIKFTQIDYRERIRQSIDLSGDGKEVLFIVCDNNKRREKEDSGKLYYFTPSLGKSVSIFDIKENCHESFIRWTSENDKFILGTRTTGYSHPEHFRLGEKESSDSLELKTMIILKKNQAKNSGENFSINKIQALSFSPDRKYLALVLNDNRSDSNDLAIINLKNFERVVFSNIELLSKKLFYQNNLLGWTPDNHVLLIHDSEENKLKITEYDNEDQMKNTIAFLTVPPNLDSGYYSNILLSQNEKRDIFVGVTYRIRDEEAAYSKSYQQRIIKISSKNGKQVEEIIYDNSNSDANELFLKMYHNYAVIISDAPKLPDTTIRILNFNGTKEIISKQISYNYSELRDKLFFGESFILFQNNIAVYIGGEFNVFPDIVYDDLQNNKIYKLTNLSASHLSQIDFPRLQVISFNASDGEEISGFVFGLAKEKPKPLIIGLNGGPSLWGPSQPLASYIHMPYYTLLAQEGFSILLLNPRGAHNYFYNAVYKHQHINFWPKQAVQDMEEAVTYLKDTLEAKISKIGVTGHSAGGNYTCWMMTLSPLVDAAVPISGIYDIYNEIFLYKNQSSAKFEVKDINRIRPYGSSWLGAAPKEFPDYVPLELQEQILNKWKQTNTPILSMDVFNQFNPIANVKNLKSAVLAFGGDQEDTNGEENNSYWAQSFFSEIKKYQKLGVLPSDDPDRYQLVIFDNEGHILKKPNNLNIYIEKTLTFFKKYLQN